MQKREARKAHVHRFFKVRVFCALRRKPGNPIENASWGKFFAKKLRHRKEKGQFDSTYHQPDSPVTTPGLQYAKKEQSGKRGVGIFLKIYLGKRLMM
jgi:hypothetical protein